ncbi:ABC transporter ATP-binding protein [Nocardioides caldifontis]|uniref:ABC transporter ATP-binding protein n=1 Tax=Nocardioides caldifontis TaxID=2588938 RepID=UPI001EF04A2C|nr:ABC transporter ATP-binding protein [Nocardioides caldifontis]
MSVVIRVSSMPTWGRTVLELRHVSAGYGEATVLHEVSLQVGQGDVVTLIGRNGAGKSTLLRSIMGLHPISSGSIKFLGRDITRLRPHRRARMGLGWVQDDRGIYSSLTVEENLRLPRVIGANAWAEERLFGTFPVLGQRRRQMAGSLSGGEQQMLALARVLRMGADVVLCDEPTEGLAPVIVDQIAEILREVASSGATILLVEQNLRFATTVAHKHFLIAEGHIVDHLDNSDVIARENDLLAHLGI